MEYAKRDLLRQFWKPTPVRAALLSASQTWNSELHGASEAAPIVATVSEGERAAYVPMPLDGQATAPGHLAQRAHRVRLRVDAQHGRRAMWDAVHRTVAAFDAPVPEQGRGAPPRIR
jgi:hypothetical protein